MSAQDLEQREMSLAVALDFADNPRPYHSMACPADTNGELYRALKTLAAALRQQPASVVDDAMRELIAEAEAAADRFESLSRTFARMTDRYGDGEACMERAYRLRAALARAQGEAA